MKRLILTLIFVSLISLRSFASTIEISTPGTSIGIGTTTPQTALDVKGTVTATSFNTPNSNTPTEIFSTGVAGDTVYVYGLNGNGNGLNDDHLVISEGTSLSSSNRIDVAPGGIVTVPTLTTTTVSGNPNFTGNVGIGSTNPTNGLDVLSSSSLHPQVKSTNVSGYAEMDFLNDQNSDLAFGINGSSNGNSAYIYVANNIPLEFSTNGSERIRIGGTGNVGIGSANPGVGLDVGGTLRIRDIGIGTTIPQELCRKSDGTFGYYNGAWTGVCN